MTTTYPSPLVECPSMQPKICDIDLLGGSNGELQDLTNRLVDRARACGTEVSTEKSEVMTNSMNNISAGISLNGQKLEEVTDVSTRIASVMAAMGKTKQDLAMQYHQLRNQVQVVQVTSIFLHVCGT